MLKTKTKDLKARKRMVRRKLNSIPARCVPKNWYNLPQLMDCTNDSKLLYNCLISSCDDEGIIITKPIFDFLNINKDSHVYIALLIKTSKYLDPLFTPLTENHSLIYWNAFLETNANMLLNPYWHPSEYRKILFTVLPHILEKEILILEKSTTNHCKAQLEKLHQLQIQYNDAKCLLLQ